MTTNPKHRHASSGTTTTCRRSHDTMATAARPLSRATSVGATTFLYNISVCVQSIHRVQKSDYANYSNSLYKRHVFATTDELTDGGLAASVTEAALTKPNKPQAYCARSTGFTLIPLIVEHDYNPVLQGHVNVGAGQILDVSE